ncbi:hypothetical protein RS83_01251 [Microbacterium oxydans]|uniref:DUF11 domain-containing protein n=1 Tax=Microbacterium oxydans TaxID=82380 RepID=A0A0F0LBQ9_9MICO|nr:hypothetical protein RS83_01251 [Microbacterium oxydans]
MTSGGALRAPRTRFCLSVVLSFVLAGGALTAIPIVFDAEAAHAEYAAGGSGRLLDSLDWFEWGEPDAAIPAEGATRTNTRVIDGQTLATTCTVSNITGGPLSAYRPGDWAGDALDDLYNVGGTDGANQLVAGLSNLDSGDTIDFRFSCAVTLDGVAVPLRGLVVADAEASNWPNGAEPGTFPEYIQATPRQPAVWRIIDRHTAADCATDGLGLLSADNTLRLRPDGRECFFSTGEPGPMAVGFMDGATSADIQIKGARRSAIALGVMLQTDFGDAPSSYGEAGALFEPTWQGGTMPVGETVISSDSFGLATQGQPNTRLGATVDAESVYQGSPDALGDDVNGNAASDEDAIDPIGLLSVTPGDTHTLPGVRCTGPGFVSGWIDWNGNGVFDTGERSDVVPCVGTTEVALTWTVPMDTVDSLGDDSTFLRLRIADTAESAGEPRGLATSGEVEDHALNVQIPQLSVDKPSDATADTRVGDVVTYSVTATNTGASAFTDEYPAIVFDDLAGVLDDATYNDDATASVAGALSYAQPLIAWSGSLDAGASVTITYTVTIRAGGDRDVRNVAWRPVDPENPVTPACDADGGTDPSTGEPCAVEQYPLPALTIDKSADQTALPAVGAEVEYSITVTNVGPGAYTASAPASATDDLTSVLDDATFDDASLTADVGSASRNGNTLSWNGALAAGASATITYSVTYTGEGDNTLTNLACVPTDEVGVGLVRCDTVTIPGAGLTQWKTASPSSDPVVAGSTITYTLFFDNDGQSAADVDAIDDLTHVLDDATVTTEPASADGLAVVRDGARISVTGSVPAGERYTVTYTVTALPDADRGDSIAANFLLAPGETPPTGPVCEPTNPARPDCTVTPITGVTYAKTVEASETPVVEGTELAYTITVRNTGATVVDVDRDDSLVDVLDDATLTVDPESDTSSVTVDGPTDDILAIRGTLAAGETARITYTVTVKAVSDRGDSSADNFLVVPGTTPPAECDPATVQCTVTPIASFTVSKTADVATTAPGGVVTYTVTLTNTGQFPYTDAVPASFSDDLSAVLDDATYNGDITAGGAVAGDELTWTGALAVGATVTVTYSVTVNAPATGDGTLANAVVPTAPGGECDPDGECIVETPMASFTVAKSADATTAMPGDVVEYTVTVTNTGDVDYTDAAPASFTDDLSGVLDDAAYNGDASAGASVTGTTLTWSGELAAGEAIEVTYSVTVNDPITGDQDLLNTVVPTAPGGTCDAEGGCATTTPVASYTVDKSVDTTSTLPGGVVTYTVTVTNTSSVDYTDTAPASVTDDLSGVLDDAVYNDDASSGATVTGSTLTWSGALPAGESLDITYSVTVDDPVTGDFLLHNAVSPTGPGGTCADVCETVTPIGSFHVVKSTDSTEVVPGQTVTYTITVTNIGQAAYTDVAPAAFSDDLSAVLDDATYNGDVASSTGAGVVYAAPSLGWSGALGIGEVVTITYSVTVNDPASGDRSLENAVVTPPGTGGNCESGSTDPDCVANVPAGSFTVEKTVSPGAVLPGDVVTYTITVTNTGKVAYTADQPAAFADDLSRVLDDATYNDDVSLGGSVAGTTLTWSRPLAVGEIVQVTYSVTVNDPVTGDFILRNVVAPSAPGGACGEAGCVTNTPIASFTVQKSADTDSVVLGGVVTYAITVTNTGKVPYTDADPASFSDDLTGVLDDATYNGDVTNGATVFGGTVDWSGPLQVGEETTVTYSVTVNQPATGDRLLRNVVVPDGPGGTCSEDCVVETPIAAFTVAKQVSRASAAVGDTITYTITVANTGRVPYTEDEPASFTEDLTSALKIATYNGDATNGATYDRPVLSWQGAVDVGGTVSVTYSVTLRDVGAIRNVVITPVESGANCAPESMDPDCVTVTTAVPPGLANTGGAAWIGGGVAGALLLVLGFLFLARRRRETQLDPGEL